MRTRTRVVHLTTIADSLELLLGPQLSAFVDAGYEVIGVSAPGAIVEAVERRGVQHIALKHSTRSMHLGKDARAFTEFTRLLRRLRPDVVHTHNPKPGLYGRLAAKLTDVPVVVNTVHGLYAQPTDPWLRRGVVYGLERVAAAFSDAELVQSAEDVAVLEQLRVPAGRIHLLGNGIDLERFRPDAIDEHEITRVRDREFGAGPGDVVFGVVARLVSEKGFREVFTAAERIKCEFPQARFVVVGPHDPEKSDALSAEMVQRTQREIGVCFLGRRGDVERLYPAMDAYILASYREGFPRSAMEAAASGLPVIATDIRGCRQVVEHGSSGLLVPPRDSDALADAIGRLLSDPQARKSMGRAGRRKAIKEFDQQHQIDLTLGVYDRLLRQAGRR